MRRSYSTPGPHDDTGSSTQRISLTKNQPMLMVEDMVSTGVSSRECLETIREAGGKPVALASMRVPAWQADNLPPHLRDIPAVKPGSRGLA